jgi:hypothetical protein
MALDSGSGPERKIDPARPAAGAKVVDDGALRTVRSLAPSISIAPALKVARRRKPAGTNRIGR